MGHWYDPVARLRVEEIQILVHEKAAGIKSREKQKDLHLIGAGVFP